MASQDRRRYLAYEVMYKMKAAAMLPKDLEHATIVYNYQKAANKGILKVCLHSADRPTDPCGHWLTRTEQPFRVLCPAGEGCAADYRQVMAKMGICTLASYKGAQVHASVRPPARPYSECFGMPRPLQGRSAHRRAAVRCRLPYGGASASSAHFWMGGSGIGIGIGSGSGSGSARIPADL